MSGVGMLMLSPAIFLDYKTKTKNLDTLKKKKVLVLGLFAA